MAATITWGGQVLGTLSLNYTACVGITPQAAALQCVAGDTPPPLAGDLVFGYGGVTLTLRDCVVGPNGFSENRDSAGRTWSLSILDRRWRWRWRRGYPVRGEYNQLDRRGKLIPWSVRSPYQLAVLLLQAMGEAPTVPGVGSAPATYSVDLPAGLAYSPDGFATIPGQPGDAGVNTADEYLNLGQNLPQTGTNPPTSWAEVPAAQALANLCDLYGRVVVYDPLTEAVSVQKIGTGAGFPEGFPALSQTPGIDAQIVPSSITVAGVPTRFQGRFCFRPVARDWDDSWVTHTEATYAPDGQAPQKMVALVYVEPGKGLVLNGVTITGTDADAMTADINAKAASAGPTDPMKGLVADALDDPSGERVIRVTTTLPGHEFDVLVDQSPEGTSEAICAAGPIAGQKGFTESSPAGFPDVKATDELTYPQARGLASASVWKCYQLVCDAPDGSAAPGVPVPGLAGPGVADPLGANPARVKDRHRIILQSTRAEQVVPRPGDESRVDPATGQPFAADVYNGYSKDREPAAFGGLVRWIQSNGNWVNSRNLVMGNTPAESQFYVPFSVIDPERQVVQFSEPVYRELGGQSAWGDDSPLPPSVAVGRKAFLPPQLVIETAVNVLEADTSAPVRSRWTLAIPGATGPAEVVVKPDVQAELIGTYNDAHKLMSTSLLDADALNRSRLYAAAIASTYQLSGALTTRWAGLVGVNLSGVVRQVTWSLSSSGFTTTASANTEHSTVIPQLPARRRLENLPSDDVRALQNLASRGRQSLAPNAQEQLGGEK